MGSVLRVKLVCLLVGVYIQLSEEIKGLIWAFPVLMTFNVLEAHTRQVP